MTQWFNACSVSDVDEDEGFKITSVRPPIAVFEVDGEYFATADTCSHADSSLSEGYVEDGKVECVWHMAQFCIKTGAALTLPATEPIRTYEVKVEGEEIHVLLDDSVLLIPA